MSNLIEKFFNEATFEENQFKNGMYHPYIPLQIAGQPTRYSVTEEGYRKFAELIIRECSKVADDNFDSGFSPTGGFILKHFGLDQKREGK
jgi:hypothetical protein